MEYIMPENFNFTASCQQGFQPKDDLYFTSELRIRAQLEAMGIRMIIHLAGDLTW
jgi:hypothetical protein